MVLYLQQHAFFLHRGCLELRKKKHNFTLQICCEKLLHKEFAVQRYICSKIQLVCQCTPGLIIRDAYQTLPSSSPVSTFKNRNSLLFARGTSPTERTLCWSSPHQHAYDGGRLAYSSTINRHTVDRIWTNIAARG